MAPAPPWFGNSQIKTTFFLNGVSYTAFSWCAWLLFCYSCVLSLYQEKIPSTQPMSAVQQPTLATKSPKCAGAQRQAEVAHPKSGAGASSRAELSSLLTALRPDHTTAPRCVVHNHEGSCCTHLIYCKGYLIALNNCPSMLIGEIACLGIF